MCTLGWFWLKTGIYLLVESLVDNQTLEEEKESEARKLLPFWAIELLGMKEEAERMHKVRKPS